MEIGGSLWWDELSLLLFLLAYNTPSTVPVVPSWAWLGSTKLLTGGT